MLEAKDQGHSRKRFQKKKIANAIWFPVFFLGKSPKTLPKWAHKNQIFEWLKLGRPFLKSDV